MQHRCCARTSTRRLPCSWSARACTTLAVIIGSLSLQITSSLVAPMRFDGASECGGRTVRDEFGALPRRHFTHCHRNLDFNLRHTAFCAADLWVRSQTELWHTFEDEISMPSRPDILRVSETECETMRSCGGSHPCLTRRLLECGGSDRQGLCAPPKTRGGSVEN